MTFWDRAVRVELAEEEGAERGLGKESRVRHKPSCNPAPPAAIEEREGEEEWTKEEEREGEEEGIKEEEREEEEEGVVGLLCSTALAAAALSLWMAESGERRPSLPAEEHPRLGHTSSPAGLPWKSLEEHPDTC